MNELIINLGYVIYGEDFRVLKNSHVVIDSNGVISEVGHGFLGGYNTINMYGDVAIPRLINSHVHVADYSFLDYSADLSLEELVEEPNGLKYRLLSRLSPEMFKRRTIGLLKELLKQGTYAICDFREGGLKWCSKAYEIKQRFKEIKYLIYGMPVSRDPNELSKELRLLRNYIDGIAISTPTHYNVEFLKILSREVRSLGLKLMTHIAETLKVRKSMDLELAVDHLKPNAIVHGTYLSKDDLELLKSKGITLIICPRANAWFKVGLPPLKDIYELGINVGLGTDNCGWNKPDLWREIEFLIYLLRIKLNFTDWIWVLKALTITPSKLLDVEPPLIREGLKANFMILNGDLLGVPYSGDVLLTILKRGSSEYVKAVLTDGVLRYV